jgi:hypothetical protein
MNYEYGYCIGCGCPMFILDDDPNGEHNAICARCRAEEAHDFDAFPNVKFGRDGGIIDTSELDKLLASIARLEQKLYELRLRVRELRGPLPGPWEDHKI